MYYVLLITLLLHSFPTVGSIILSWKIMVYVLLLARNNSVGVIVSNKSPFYFYKYLHSTKN